MINTQAIINALALTLWGLAASPAQAGSLNKCVDAYGKVTYSNLPCKGANQIRKIEIDPAPPVPPPAPALLPIIGMPKVIGPVFEMPEKIPNRTSPPLEKKAQVKLETFGTAPKKQTQNNCDTLTDKLGLVLDKMDAARRKGYTQKQLDEWNLEIKGLERKKQQAGCF